MTRGKLAAHVIVAIFIGIIAFLGVRSVSGPQMYDGDRLETRTCRWCNGTGKDGGGDGPEGGPRPADGVCPGCRGAQKSQVIIPGPKHPTPLKGSVRDATLFPGGADAVAMVELTERSKPMQPIQGAVREAKIVFDGPTKLEISSLATGKFRCQLEPGQYTLTVTASGFKEFKQSLTVPQRKNPIWQEKAKLVTEEQADDTLVVPVLLSH